MHLKIYLGKNIENSCPPDVFWKTDNDGNLNELWVKCKSAMLLSAAFHLA